MSRSVAKFQLTTEQQKLVAENLNLARREAWRYQRRTEIDYKILESVAFEGLCQAAHRYDPNMLNGRTGKPMRFSSIAVPYTRGAILHYMRDKTYLLRLSHKMREHWLKGRKLIYQGESDISIAEKLGVSLQEWLETRITCSGPPLELKETGAPTVDPDDIEIDLASVYIKDALEFVSKLDQTEVQYLQKSLIDFNTKVPIKQVKKLLDLNLGC